MANRKAGKATKARTARTSIARPTQHALDVLRRDGISYRISHGGRRFTVTGRGRAPRPLFPKSRFAILRKLTY